MSDSRICRSASPPGGVLIANKKSKLFIKKVKILPEFHSNLPDSQIHTFHISFCFFRSCLPTADSSRQRRAAFGFPDFRICGFRVSRAAGRETRLIEKLQDLCPYNAKIRRGFLDPAGSRFLGPACSHFLGQGEANAAIYASDFTDPHFQGGRFPDSQESGADLRFCVLAPRIPKTRPDSRPDAP